MWTEEVHRSRVACPNERRGLPRSRVLGSAGAGPAPANAGSAVLLLGCLAAVLHHPKARLALQGLRDRLCPGAATPAQRAGRAALARQQQVCACEGRGGGLWHSLVPWGCLWVP